MIRYDSVGGRRFLLSAASLITATILQCCDKLDPNGSSYAMIIVGTVAAYITGNVVEGKNNVGISAG